MAKDKDRTLNPAAAHLKSEKNKALKKGKAAVAAQRSERLARRNPERLQRQVDELRATREAQGGTLRPRDAQELEKLEREVGMILKAREGAGASGGERRRGEDERGGGRGREGDRGRGRGRGTGPSMLGKRRRDGDRDDDGFQSDETDPDVRGIAMPRDTPPPVPRRPRVHGNEGEGENTARRTAHPLPVKPTAQTTYSSAPQLRDLQKESTRKFVPAAVAARLKQRQDVMGAGGGDEKNGGRLLEPEEVDALERGGYLDSERAAEEAAKEDGFAQMSKADGVGVDAGTLEEEEEAFERELRDVEEAENDTVEDEDTRRDVERELLEQEAKRDAKEAADAAAEEEQHNMMAHEALKDANGARDDFVEEESSRRVMARETLEQESKKDADEAAEAAAQEATHNMMAQEALGSVVEGQKVTAERNWRHVEIEEVEDEDL